MKHKLETVIIGGGQAGLATSYYLGLQGRENLILDKSAQAGNAWRNDRWDSFCLVTPNWSFRLPGAEYTGPQPDGFMPREEVVACFERYVERFKLPVQYRTEVTSIEYDPEPRLFKINTGQAVLEAANVVVATGLYQTPNIPAYAAEISPSILQLHSGKYRNPNVLPPGAVLVVGSGQSGGQIAEELYQAGRKVYLCTGNAGGAPRRYRGKDIYEWVLLTGFLDRTADQLPSPKARFASNPQLSGKNGGHSLNLHQFYRDGVILLGRLQGASHDKIWLSADLKENLAKGDQLEAEIVKMVDDYIARSGIEAPEETLPVLRDGYEAPELREIRLAEAGISTVIWAIGYRFDFSLVKLPVFDDYGYPIQKRGITAYPGLYFVGLPWLYRRKSGLLVGFGEDAEFIANDIAAAGKRRLELADAS